ncbi:predicted protein [Aspergillus terreus NIH2624]|uniref:Uncharacterized protein n=1 Tax=Aspergillus terreus (strain NIH 2624 / FGSC A1156) TaxID=341663 RepID=Q0C8Q5_ASPTN|nr:uncharacterized protein ATEG_09929 [Aspergillus terreus NIH2624]EAU30120.1 predicted protein [Aspergillus terreus NIH2624]
MAGDGRAVHVVSNQPITPRRERPSLLRAPALGLAPVPRSHRHDRSRSRVAAGIYLVLLTASIAVMILAVLLLTVPSVKDAGIVTFEFQWDLTVPRERLQPRSGIVFAPDIPKVVETVTRAAEPTGTTIITDETQSVSQVLSGTASTVPTATDKLPGRPHFETGLPRQLSLGTRRFCIQHEHDRCECQPLPVHLSRAMPELAPEVLAHVTEPLQHIEVAVVTPVTETITQIRTGCP